MNNSILKITTRSMICGSLVCMSSCTSAVSTHVTPDPVRGGWATNNLRGIPITVKVPTHLELRVTERRYIDSNGKYVRITPRNQETSTPPAPGANPPNGSTNSNSNASAGVQTQTSITDNPILSTRSIEVTVREKDEVFTVDAVRPASGTLAYQAEFRGQYFKTFNSKVEDKTLESITNAIKNITGEVEKTSKALSAGSIVDSSGKEIPFVDHLVAVKLFDVYDPMLAQSVREFLHTYVNGCNPPCPATMPCPPVTPIQR